MKKVRNEMTYSPSMEDSFHETEDSDSEKVLNSRYCIFPVEEKKQIVQLLKNYIIKVLVLPASFKKTKKNVNWLSLLDEVGHEKLSKFIREAIPSFVIIYANDFLITFIAT